MICLVEILFETKRHALIKVRVSINPHTITCDQKFIELAKMSSVANTISLNLAIKSLICYCNPIVISLITSQQDLHRCGSQLTPVIFLFSYINPLPLLVDTHKVLNGRLIRIQSLVTANYNICTYRSRGIWESPHQWAREDNELAVIYLIGVRLWTQHINDNISQHIKNCSKTILFFFCQIRDFIYTLILDH